MKKLLKILMIAIAITAGSAMVMAQSKSAKSGNKGYKIENGKIIPTGSKPVVVDMYADWCGPCRMYAPVFESVAKRYASKAIFIRINVDDNAAVSQYYNVTSIPMTIVIGKNGKKLGERVGSMDEDALINLINSSK